MTGLYRRRIILHAEGRRVFAALEDDYHHLYSQVFHDGRVVTRASGKSLRIPYTACPGAGERVERFVGYSLDQGARGLDPGQQCTHLYDLTRLAMAQALRASADDAPAILRRQYDIAVGEDMEDGSTREAEISRDGERVLHWTLIGASIISPAEFACENAKGKVDWKHLDGDTFEASTQLRRGVWLSGGRKHQRLVRQRGAQGLPLDGPSRMITRVGACYTYQPERQAERIHIMDSNRDYTHRPEAMLGELSAFMQGGAAPQW